jgi:Mor family transcriptional regulator
VDGLTRNQKMMAEFEAGQSIDRLMATYGLSRAHVHIVLQEERNKRLVSPLSFYRKLRDERRNTPVSNSR